MRARFKYHFGHCQTTRTAMQTSFRKKQRSAVPSINGTQPSLHNGQLLCSTGVPSLDAVLGGGIPVGTVLLIEEDANNQYASLLTRYYAAEGVISNHALFLVSHEEKSSYLHNLPEPVLLSKDRDDSPSSSDMKIAWRYQNLGQVQSSMGNVSKYGHYFDISKTMDKTRLETCKTTSISLKTEYCKADSEEFDAFKHTLMELDKFIKTNHYDITSAIKSQKPMNILRIIIPSFESPFWSANVQKIVQFLICLKAITRNALSVCWLTIPAYIHPQSTVQLIRHNVDTVVRLEAFGAEKTNPLYKEYHGLLHIEKLPALNCLLPYMPDTLDLAFKLRRKKFSIERLHLPPDIGETDPREGSGSGQTSGCSSGASKSSLDF